MDAGAAGDVIYRLSPCQHYADVITDLLGDKMPSTIMAGVILLWSEGSYPVALVIFIAQYYGTRR